MKLHIPMYSSNLIKSTYYFHSLFYVITISADSSVNLDFLKVRNQNGTALHHNKKYLENGKKNGL